jgi:hypothetical protein
MERGGGGGFHEGSGGGFHEERMRVGEPERRDMRANMYFGRRRGGRGNPIFTSIFGVIFAVIGFLFTSQSVYGWIFVILGVLLFALGIFMLSSGRRMSQQPPMQPYGQMPQAPQQQMPQQQQPQPQSPPMPPPAVPPMSPPGQTY